MVRLVGPIHFVVVLYNGPTAALVWAFFLNFLYILRNRLGADVDLCTRRPINEFRPGACAIKRRMAELDWEEESNCHPPIGLFQFLSKDLPLYFNAVFYEQLPDETGW